MNAALMKWRGEEMPREGVGKSFEGDGCDMDAPTPYNLLGD